MRLLYARVGEPRCPEHGITLEAQTVSQMVDLIMELPDGTKTLLLSPIVQGRKGEHRQLLDELYAQGFVRARIDGVMHELSALPELEKNNKHDIELVVDRLVIREGHQQRLAESLETALAQSDGVASILTLNDDGSDADSKVFSAKYACSKCGYSIAELEPRIFSFNNPSGACQTCDGLGMHQYFDPERLIF